jgi:glycosyltransferase involved in cell wall biosynthesis
MIEAAKVSTAGGQPAAARLRVLVLDEEFPYPPNSGKRIRTWNLLRRLARAHELRLICFGELTDVQREAAASAGIEVRTLPALDADRGVTLVGRLLRNLFSALPYSVQKHMRGDFQRAVADEVRSFSPQLIHCEWGPYAAYREPHAQIPAVIVAHNVESMIWQRRAAVAGDPLRRWFFGLQAKRMDAFERAQMPRAAQLIAVSEADAQMFRSWGARCVTVDNGVDLDFYAPDATAEVQDRILFLASLDWFPNVDALNYFVDAMLPAIRRARPQATLRIVGRRLSAGDAARFAKVPGVQVIGEVEDVRKELRSASVVVVPLRIGGGSRLKILEALAAGKAVVSTTVGAEGLAVEDDSHLRIADAPEQFAAVVCELLGDSRQRQALGRAGRALVEARYGWDALARQMESAWHDAVTGERQ